MRVILTLFVWDSNTIGVLTSKNTILVSSSETIIKLTFSTDILIISTAVLNDTVFTIVGQGKVSVTSLTDKVGLAVHWFISSTSIFKNIVARSYILTNLFTIMNQHCKFGGCFIYSYILTRHTLGTLFVKSMTIKSGVVEAFLLSGIELVTKVTLGTFFT